MAKHADDRFASMDGVVAALKRCSGRTLSATRERSTMGRMPATRTGRILEPSAVLSLPTGTGTGPLFVAASKTGTSTPALYLAGLFVLTGVAGVLAIGNPFDRTTPAVQTPVAAANPQAAQRSVGEAEEDLTDRTVLVSLRSTPPGATVLVEGQEYGPTPTQFEWTGADAAYGRVVKFLFRRQGYHDVTVTRQVRGERLDVHAPPLEPLPQVRKPARVPDRAAGALAPADLPEEEE